MQISNAALTRKRSILPEARTERRRSAGRTLASTLVAGHLFKRKEERLVFFWKGLRKEKTKEALADGGTTVTMG